MTLRPMRHLSSPTSFPSTCRQLMRQLARAFYGHHADIDIAMPAPIPFTLTAFAAPTSLCRYLEVIRERAGIRRQDEAFILPTSAVTLTTIPAATDSASSHRRCALPHYLDDGAGRGVKEGGFSTAPRSQRISSHSRFGCGVFSSRRPRQTIPELL